MDNETKQKINQRYERELNRGERFWPDSIYKDLIVSLAIFIILILLATFIGVAPEAKADPADTSYLPRPEWYFLFLFKFLALYGQIPFIGKIEWLATVLVPGVGVGLLTLLPFIDKSPYRHYSRRIFALTTMGVIILDIVLLTIMASLRVPRTDADLKIQTALQAAGGLWIPLVALTSLLGLYVFNLVMDRKNESLQMSKAIIYLQLGITGLAALGMFAYTSWAVKESLKYPKPEETEVATTLVDQIVAGQDLYSVHCVECHGDDGSVDIIEGVEGLEGEEITPINGTDVLYTLTDSAMYEVIAYGRPNAGMPPLGKAYNPEGISRSEIDHIIIFMRYTWDDRFEAPPMKPLFPALADGEVPSYEVHIAPIVKRYCISCHRADKDNNDYLMTTYDEVLTTGENKDKNIIAGDPNSYLLQVIQGTPIMDPQNPSEEMIGVMPPKGHLKSDAIDAFLRWIMNGMPEKAEDAAKLFIPPSVEPTITP